MVPSLPHPPIVQRETFEPIDPIDHVDLVAPVDVPRDIAVGRKRSAWACHTLEEEEGYAAPHGTFRKRNIPHKYL